MGASATRISASMSGKNACLAFNLTNCQESESHKNEFLHVCSFCLAAFVAEHDHPILACNKRLTYRKGRDRNDCPDYNYQYKNADWQQSQGNKPRGSFYNRDNQVRNNYQPKIEAKNWNQPPPQEARNWPQFTQQ